MLKNLDLWLDAVLGQEIPGAVAAFCLNIYEDADDRWSVELVGCDRFDEADEDWACDEVTTLGTRDNPYSWQEETRWKSILEKVMATVNAYLEQGRNRDILKSRQAVAVGFVDGDVELLWRE